MIYYVMKIMIDDYHAVVISIYKNETIFQYHTVMIEIKSWMSMETNDDFHADSCGYE